MTPLPNPPSAHEDDPLWYKDAIIYEAHVRAFYDSDGDGTGDFQGLTQKLGYLQDLGITAIWLLPFYPSPLKDDGYDISDYTQVHPDYGTMRDFRAFLREAARRGIRVITELVINHTSDQHPWFQRARQAPPGDPARDFYVWSDTPDKYPGTRIIFQDFETSNWSWDPVAKAFYWHRFYRHQPDLNFDNPEVRRAVLRAMDFYFSQGVSGLRLDAVPYLVEREGTNCENLPETHQFLKELRRHVDRRFKNRMLLAEANQWPEDTAAYFGEGDECHMAFHFPIMPRLFMALRLEDRFPIVEILQQTPPIPETCQWALFLRNHDELTLEMVTDEERDFMFRRYAPENRMRLNQGIRRRLGPLLNNDRKKIELMNALLFSLPGSPVLYYGDEIGMGDNFYLGDRNGVRTPMQWSAGPNAGFSEANPQRLFLPVIIDPEYHYEAVNVATQQTNADSLLWWMKRLIALRKRHQAFARGGLQFLASENRKVLTFVRRYRDETLLVVANLSRLAQHVQLDLGQFSGRIPVELFGQGKFPTVGVAPYIITLSPYAFYWFSLEPQPVEAASWEPSAAAVPTLAVGGDWTHLLDSETRGTLGEALISYLPKCRWFGGKTRDIRSSEILDVVTVNAHHPAGVKIVLIQVEYGEGEPETYLLPLTASFGRPARRVAREFPQAIVAHLQLTGPTGQETGVLYDALADSRFNHTLLEGIAHHRVFRGEKGEVLATASQLLRQVSGPSGTGLEPVPLRVEQSNTSVAYGDRLILKLFRRLGEGTNPELEIGRFLTETACFPHIPQVMGALEYRRHRTEEPATLGILQAYVPNQGDAWSYTLDCLGHYFEHALAHPEMRPEVPVRHLLSPGLEVPALARETIGPYLGAARLLGQRTGQLHLALGSASADPVFSPEPFTDLYRRSIYQSTRTLTEQVFSLLRQGRSSLGPEARSIAGQVLDREAEVQASFRTILSQHISGQRIRCHGDYHLGQVLYTGNDFVIIDFEGEPTRPLTERRLKRSPLRDVAGMVRSFHYATHAALLGQAPGLVRPEDLPQLERWGRLWYFWVSASFLAAYREALGPSPLLPGDPAELRVLLDFWLLEKAVYEIGYELNHRPAWVAVPLRGVLQLLETGQ